MARPKIPDRAKPEAVTVAGIIDYGLGNLTSVQGAVRRLGHEPVVSADAEILGRADKLILPGVGAFGDGMRNLARRGLVAPLNRLVMDDNKPILGICLGAQLMCRESAEFGNHEGLGWVDARVIRLTPADPALRVPHVGWDDMMRRRDSALFDDVPDDSLFYYVHSFAIEAAESDIVLGECDYGQRFTAAFERRNIFAVQFHPEKSQLGGLTMLGNFLNGT